VSAVIVRCEDPLGFLTEAAKDPRFKDGDLALLTRIILNQRGARELEELGPEKMIRAKLQRLELLGYCVHDKTLSRRFQVGGKAREQRNKLVFIVGPITENTEKRIED
jgi:hypothetical protein